MLNIKNALPIALVFTTLALFPLQKVNASDLSPLTQTPGPSFFNPFSFSQYKLRKQDFDPNKTLFTKNSKYLYQIEPAIFIPDKNTTKSNLPDKESPPEISTEEIIIAEEVKIIVSPTPSPDPSIKLLTDTPEPPKLVQEKPKISTSQLSNTNIGGLNPEKLYIMSNNYRVSKNLPPFQKDERACALAQIRAPEIAREIEMDTMHQGMYGRNLPYWNTENIITMRTEEEAFNWWINDYIHRIAIEGDYKYSCVACFSNACAQEFTNFIPK